MSGPGTNRLPLLLAITFMVGALHAQQTCATTVHVDDTPCHTGETNPPLPDAAAPAADDCCAPDGDDCGPTCCTGVAMYLTAAPAAAVRDCARTRPPAGDTDLSWVDPDPLYHPPQS